MYTNEEQSQLNNFLERETFTMETNFFGGESNFEFEYKFKLVGIRKMMSVGEYYDYIRVFVTIVGGEDRLKTLLKIFTDYKQLGKIEEFLKGEYRFNGDLSRDISDNLKYFSDGKDHVRVHIESITISDKFFNEIKNIDLNL
jgi:hypothetical protein